MCESSKVKLYTFSELMPQKVVYVAKLKAYEFIEDYAIRIYTSEGNFDLKFKAGYVSNCGSIPKPFQWFLKSYDADNTLYNAAFFLHDDGYQKGGWGRFKRDDVDALCRGMLRESHINRLHASMMDLAVGLFAGRHWKTNEYNNLECMSTFEEAHE